MDPRDFVKYIIGLIIGILVAFFMNHDFICVSYPDFCLYGYVVVGLIIIVSIFGFYRWITSESKPAHV